MSYLDIDLNDVRRDCRDFRQRCQSVHLALHDESEQLDLGCSPFIQLDEEFLVYLNQCSALGGGLMNEGCVDLMFIEDEINSPQTFARRQLTIRGSATTVPRGYQHTRSMVAFQDRLGSFMDIIRRMPDACLIRVKPLAGRYINELAQTFTFKGHRLDALHGEVSSSGQSLSPGRATTSVHQTERTHAGES